MRALPLLMLSLLTAAAASAHSAEARRFDFCDDYRVCLERLEAKQRECLKLPALEREDFVTRAPELEECRRRRKDLQRRLYGLQLRQTEVERDCVASNANDAQDLKLLAVQQHKCESAAEKLQIFNELLLNPKSGLKAKPSKPKRRHATVKQSQRVCRRVKKMLSKKCAQLSRCCSLAEECDDRSDHISDQITQLRRLLRESQSTKNHCD